MSKKKIDERVPAEPLATTIQSVLAGTAASIFPPPPPQAEAKQVETLQEFLARVPGRYLLLTMMVGRDGVPVSWEAKTLAEQSTIEMKAPEKCWENFARRLRSLASRRVEMQVVVSVDGVPLLWTVEDEQRLEWGYSYEEARS